MCIISRQAFYCGCSPWTVSLYTAVLGLIVDVGEIIIGVIVLMVRNGHSKGANPGVFVKICSLGISCVRLILNILLIVAIKQRRSDLVFLWLAEFATAQLALIGFSILCFVTRHFLAAIILLADFGTKWYFWWLFYSFYREMKFAEENPAAVGLNTIS